MKIITATAAALFLFAATGIASAQSDGEGGSGSDGNNAGSSSGTNNNQGNGNNNQGTGNNNDPSANANDPSSNANEDTAGETTGSVGGNDCTDYKPGTEFSQMSPKCRDGLDSWAMGQSGSMKYDGDFAVGTVLPDTVTYVDVPTYTDYGYVMLNDRRVLVDRKNRTVVHVYE